MKQEIVNAQYIGHGSPFERPSLNRMLVSICVCKNIVRKMCIRCRQLTRLKNSAAREVTILRDKSTVLGKAAAVAVALWHEAGRGGGQGRAGEDEEKAVTALSVEQIRS